MKLVAFDTSNTVLSVAVMEEEQVLAEMTVHIKKNHSGSLMPVVDFLVQQVGWTPRDLDRIVVAQGPGSYTGLRIGVATAKTLAHTLKIDLVGVSSLLSLVPDQSGLVIPLMDARRNHVYAGFYENGRAVFPEAHLSFEEVLDRVKDFSEVTFVGEVRAFKEQIQAGLPQAQIQESMPSAERIGKIGLRQEVVSIHDFVPNYLKRVEAEENWLKDHEERNRDYIQRL